MPVTFCRPSVLQTSASCTTGGMGWTKNGHPRHSVLQTSASCTSVAALCTPQLSTAIRYYKHQQVAPMASVYKAGAQVRHSVLQTSASCTSYRQEICGVDDPPFGITNISKLHSGCACSGTGGTASRHSVLQTSASCTFTNGIS